MADSNITKRALAAALKALMEETPFAKISVGDILLAICEHLYENRDFYRKAFKIAGQNSFAEYFREMLEPLIDRVAQNVFAEEEDRSFTWRFTPARRST